LLLFVIPLSMIVPRKGGRATFRGLSQRVNLGSWRAGVGYRGCAANGNSS
jgi:hypothetical protein